MSDTTRKGISVSDLGLDWNDWFNLGAWMQKEFGILVPNLVFTYLKDLRVQILPENWWNLSRTPAIEEVHLQRFKLYTQKELWIGADSAGKLYIYVEEHPELKGE